MNKPESSITPNSFQTPNAYVDEAMYLLTPEEYVVLSFIDRHILGWQEKVMERKGVISLTMIVEGYQSKKTGRWFHGTGLSRPTVNKCLDALTAYGFIVPEGKPTQKGQTWVLADNPDYDALLERHVAKKASNDLRMARVRGKSDLPVNDIDPAQVNVIDPQEGIYDLRKQRHLERQNTKTEKKKDIASVDASASRFQNPDGSAKWPDSDEVSTLRLEGEEQNTPAPTKTKAKTKTTTAPSPIAPPPSPKEKPILAWVIDDAWAGTEGKRTSPDTVNKRLIPVLMGTSKKFDCVEPAATEAEILGFTRWYRYNNPRTPLPMEAKLASWFGSFRRDSDSARFIQTGQRLINTIYRPTEAAPAPVEPEIYPDTTETHADFWADIDQWVHAQATKDH